MTQQGSSQDHGDFCTGIILGTDYLGVVHNMPNNSSCERWAAILLHQGRTAVPSFYRKYSTCGSARGCESTAGAKQTSKEERQKRGDKAASLTKRQQTSTALYDTMQYVVAEKQIEKLHTNARVCFEYIEYIPNSLIEVEGFSLILAERTETSGKSWGGHLSVSDSWCRLYTVRETVSNTKLNCSARPWDLFIFQRSSGTL